MFEVWNLKYQQRGANDLVVLFILGEDQFARVEVECEFIGAG